MPQCPFALITHLSWCLFFLVPICPKVPIMPQMPTCPNAHYWSQSAPLPQSAHSSKCQFVPVPTCPQCSFVPYEVPICPKCTRCSKAHRCQNAHFLKCSFVPVLTCSFVPNTHLPKVLISPNCPMPICFGAHFFWWPFPPNAHLPSITKYCPNVHRFQSAHLLHSAHLPWCSFFLVPIFSKYAFAPNAHLAQSSSVLKCPFAPKCPFPQTSIYPNSHMPICSIYPNCSFTPIAQSPFSLVRVFPGAHFSLKPTCPTVHRSQNTHLLQSTHLPQLLICPGAHFSWCSFALNAHFP